MIQTVRRLALPIAITSLIVNGVILLAAFALWGLAIYFGWTKSVEFVSHMSMLALAFAGISGVASGLAGLLTLVPTDDIIPVEEEE